MATLNFYGVGPKIGRIVLPYLGAAIVATLIFPGIFTMGEQAKQFTFYPGLVLLVAGLIFYFISVRFLLRGLQETKLVTHGTYRCCRNPLYAAIILGIIPGIALMMNSWAVLTTSVVGYIVFKTFIRGEYTEMESVFGEDYRKYSNSTPEFFPWVGR